MKKIFNFISPFYNHMGISRSAINLIKSMYLLNANFSILDISKEFNYFSTNSCGSFENILNKLMISNCDNFDTNILNSNLNMIKKLDNDYIPYFFINTNSIPSDYVKLLKDKEKILVYNNFSKDILISSGINEQSIHILKPSINVGMFKNSNKFEVNGKRSYCFLSVCRSLNSEWIDVLKSFYDSFSDSDDVCLVLKCYDIHYSKYNQLNIARIIDSEKRKYQKKVPPVILISSSLSDSEMASLYKDCDCYVKISDINTGISFIEAFASGMACIGPESGSARDILNRETGFMIKKDKEKRISNGNDFDGITYNVYSRDHLSDSMKWVFNNWRELKGKSFKERKLVLSEFDYNLIGQKFLKIVR